MIKHGESTRTFVTPEYRVWRDMNARCYIPSLKNYKYYGGRGITVCERWRKSYLNFLQDVGRRPSDKHSLDRFPNKDGNYEPENTRWATPDQQARNQSKTRLITFQGKTLCIADWSKVINVYPQIIKYRLDSGWSIEKALTTPNRQRSLEIKVKNHFEKENKQKWL